MTDDIPAGKVEAVADAIDSAARAPMSEIMARGIPRYALIAIAAISAADAWDAEHCQPVREALAGLLDAVDTVTRSAGHAVIDPRATENARAALARANGEVP